MVSIAPPYVREMARKGQICFDNVHALQRMGERRIWIDQILEAILHGEVIEVQVFESKKDVAVIFQEPVESDQIPRFYVVIAACYPLVEVVTVVEFEEEAWDWLGKIMARRRG